MPWLHSGKYVKCEHPEENAGWLSSLRILIEPRLSGFGFTVAIATVHRFVLTRFEGYFGIFAAFGTDRRVHLAPCSAVVAVSEALSFSCLAARRAALGLIGIAPGAEKLLFLGAKGKCSATVGTGERLVLETHLGMASFLKFQFEFGSSSTR